MAADFRLAVLASGRGSNLQALVDAQRRDGWPARVVGVFSDKPESGAIALAKSLGIPTHAQRPRDFAARADFDAALFDQILAVQPDLIVCAGYMRLISAATVQRVAGRMINIHPSLLPRHPGLDTHGRALAAGDAEHGASVHLVIPELDAGQPLAQARVPVFASDSTETLAARVLAREHPLLVATVEWLARGRLRVVDGHAQFQGHALSSPLVLQADDTLRAP